MAWSAQMFRNLGLAPSESGDLYATLLATIHPADRDLAEKAFVEFRTRPGPMRIETQLVWPGEGRHWVVFLGQVVADGDGVPTQMLGITIDSTRRRRNEEEAATQIGEREQRLRDLSERLARRAAQRGRALDSSRAQMQAIFDNTPDWLTLFRATADGRFVYEDMNRATEIAYGLDRDRIVGRPLEEILGVEPAQLPLRLMRACIRTGENQRYTARRTMAGKTRTVDVMFVHVPEKRDGDDFIMATARDITEREAIEDRLRQSQKMEAVGQLTGGLAHDFNNLLTAVIGNLELLTPRLKTDPTAARFLAAAQRAAENGAKLTEQLLAFSRRQHLQPRAVDLNTIIEGMRDLLVRTIGTTIRVSTALARGLRPALVDPTQIEVAVLNLAINARDAMPLGGTLTIETRNLRHGRDPIPAELGDGDCLCLSVRDTGSGMTAEVLESAVEPFFTTKEVGKGSGLGLSQVYGMVRQSNGAMQIESRVGAGTTVHLYLPSAAAEAGHVEDEGQRPGAERISGRILVVDDNTLVREVTAQMLRELGYGVTEGDNGHAALDALSRGEAYDLLLIDVAMPGLNGVETVRRAREIVPGLRALYMTGYADLVGPEHHTGDDPLIKKPFRLAELAAEVQAAIRRLPPGSGDNVVRLPERG
ncbi:MAG TPA: ATP-binding protein [Stellaceae bacterium]|nr:ATP-binding protein [Stellaceae bacterium]